MIVIALLLLLADGPPVQLPPVKAEIVVTPERGAEQRDAVAAAVTVITREEIAAQPAQSLAEIVDEIPGMTMFFAGAAAGAPMIASRGFFGGGEVEYVKLLIDGVPAGDAESGLIDWRHVRVAGIDRIEILRGPGSSLYGDASMGGVIQVFTRTEASDRAELRLSGGTLGTRSADVSLRAGVAGVNAFVATTAGYRDHSASRDSGGDLTLQRAFDGSRVRFSATLSSKDRQEPGPLTSAELAEDRRASNDAFALDREKTERRRIALTYETFGSTSIRAVLHAADRATDFPRTFLLAPGFGSTLERRLDTDSAGGTFEIARQWTRGALRAGADLDRASVHNDYGVVSARAKRNSTAFFATGDWEPAPRLRISSGVRRDEVGGQSAWSPRLGATFHAGGASLFVQLARAFKAPTLDQLFDPRPFPGPGGTTFAISNPALRPQRARNAEAGVSRGTARAAWSVSVYRMNVTDEIDFDPTFFVYSNIRASRHTGLEAMAERREGIVQPLVTYAWTRVAPRLKNIPEHVAQLIVRLPHATVGYRWEHARFAADGGGFPLPDVRTVNAKLYRQFGPLRAELEVQNVFDAKYSYLGSILFDFQGRPSVLEFPAPGRTARVNLIWSRGL